MGRELQKKKNRSSIPKQTRRRNARIHKVTINDPIIKANWDKSLTVSQNYKRLGLVGKINKPAGGVEKTLSEARVASEKSKAKKLKTNKNDILDLAPGEARIERDPETGAALRVIYGKSGEERLNELSDVENQSSDDTGEQDGMPAHSKPTNPGAPGVITQLEVACSRGVSTSKMRTQSQGEKEWIESLVRKHGENYLAMVKDRKLNPYQQSEGDIKKRIKIWREKGGEI